MTTLINYNFHYFNLFVSFQTVDALVVIVLVGHDSFKLESPRFETKGKMSFGAKLIKRDMSSKFILILKC